MLRAIGVPVWSLSAHVFVEEVRSRRLLGTRPHSLPACCVSPCATGAEVLRDGGNAVDAAVATVLCQGIYNPMASGAGGGHFMLIRRAPCGAAKELQHATE